MPDTPENDPVQLFIETHGRGDYSPEVQRQFQLLLARTGRIGTGEDASDAILKGPTGPQPG